MIEESVYQDEKYSIKMNVNILSQIIRGAGFISDTFVLVVTV
jgi:hypothetical protein